MRRPSSARTSRFEIVRLRLTLRLMDSALRSWMTTQRVLFHFYVCGFTVPDEMVHHSSTSKNLTVSRPKVPAKGRSYSL
ncbi:MAG: hypothetical protein AAFP83_16450 [Bacteroidota bacterium]